MIQKNSPLPISKPSELPKFANIGLGGIAGAGKTHLLGTVGKGKKVLILDTEGGSSTYSSAAFKATADATDKIDVITFDDVTKAADLVHRIESTLDYLIKTNNSDGYELVALDSLTEFQERFLSLHEALDKRQSYGAVRDSLYSIVHKARRVPAHTVFTARLKAAHDEVLGREVVRFEVSPGVYSVISGLFDVIAFLDVKRVGLGNNAKIVRTFDPNHGIRFSGKDRFGIGEVETPTFSKIASKISGGK
jgi:hypothetical protein